MTQPQPPDLVGTLRTALSQLAAPERVIIRDFEGNEFALPAGLPARRQVRVFATLAQLIDAGQKRLPQEELTGTGVLKLLVQALGDEALVEKLGRTFSVAYPNVAGERDPLDVFPIEEILSSLLPLFVRFLRRTGSWLLDVT
jgi:hypothetical protein